MSKDNALAVVVSQSSKDRITAELSVPGYELQDFASARNDVVIEGKAVTLRQHSLAVLYYRKTVK
ncbi:MAG: hypothetical protein J6X55_09240 [Victivallales bacterium]|nr:hypothetical protein [Victivallales bacterium]